MKKITTPVWLQRFIVNKKLLILVIFLILSISATASYFFFSQQKDSSTESKQTSTQEFQKSEIDLGAEPEDLKQLNILLLGYGGAGHEGGFLADAIQILHINFEQGRAALISIPRDLWVSLPDGRQAKINQSLTLHKQGEDLVKGGSKTAMQMAQIVTGLEMNYYVAVDFVGFKRAIGETLGGITVDVPETLDDPWYPKQGEQLNPCGYSPEEIAELTAQYSGFELEKQFECRYDHIHFDQGLNEMEGGDALAYIRSRHGSAAGDFSRSQRQQALLKGIRDRLLEKEVLANIPDFYNKITQNVTSDIDLDVVKYLAPALKSAFDFEVKEVIISTDNVLMNSKSADGQFIVVPKAGQDEWEEVQGLVKTEIDN